ncbi:GlxA family transcriptional regulator [Pseudoalteromonas luteoviolacea]|uniref:Transcriptional regulator n=1 Tax=Pseudoalteromonas luteoviolacea S4054 TaxID=1129367 RepID=A0A0F6ABV0_9GAMM|nr:helix-turn-helix domain-containing protein [Pseudoalteromonas luteoviolacea]AOT10816.1 transcriptional regulator [Pseudoalteromonas luteoviolacea]AOT16022.1 transcriptional regulator [Pseudoalteromonas luteoviolacea]AOT20637.1 transcriptional regulator [Pseudoalteromonas luteoviolacea]KKE82859.1 transcriptional regulator [Pseudoalteromonas luteoviolacea S4054]KZN75260.1 transcriptional regulator [Pseudoalteromonas luteoviolacea S4047-1]
MTIYFVLLADTLPLDFAGPLQVFIEAKRLGFLDYEISYVSASEQLSCDGGLQLANLASLPPTLAPEDIIVLPGCHRAFDSYSTQDARETIQWLKNVIADHTVLTICSGAVLAAKAGLLVNKSCTTHYQLIDTMRTAFPQCHVLDNRIFVEDTNIISSAGISSGIDMAIYYVTTRYGEHIGAQVAQEMLVYFRRTGQDPQLSSWLQYRNHMHRSIHKVQDAICSNVTEHYSLEQLADIAHLSQRQLSRLFSVHLGISPREYLQHIRIGHAKQLLKHSNNSVEIVAQNCGYSSGRQFRRAFTQTTHMSPQQYRQQYSGV